MSPITRTWDFESKAMAFPSLERDGFDEAPVATTPAVDTEARILVVILRV